MSGLPFEDPERSCPERNEFRGPGLPGLPIDPPVTAPIRVPDLDMLFLRLKQGELSPGMVFHLERLEVLIKKRDDPEVEPSAWWADH